MPDYRLLAQLQHKIQYPSAHLDRFAQFGPAFEMAGARTPDHTSTQDAVLRANQDTDTYRLAHEPRETSTPESPESLVESPIATVANIRQFVTGGRAIFTLQGKSTRYTFKVTRKDPEPGTQYSEPIYFVAVLTGPDNTSDYTYVGVLDVRAGRIRLTRKSTYTDASTPVRAFNWAIGLIWAGRELPAPAAFYHVGRCGRCGRALTVPSSIESGFGPECLGKLGE